MQVRSGWNLGVGLALGVLLGAGLAYGHFTGFFAPLYHAAGWHSLAHQAEQHETVSATDHAGHAGMAVPKVVPAKIPGYSIVHITPERQQLIGVRTGPVVRDRLVMAIRTVGVLEPDQTRLARIHTRISGWVTRVHVNFIGQMVQKGDPLLELYSPELLATQYEYLIALEGLKSRPADLSQQQLLASTRRRLELWGVAADEIQTLEKTQKARETLTLRAPISGRVLERNVLEGTYVEPASELYRLADLSVLWLQAKVYEHELPHVELGQPVRVSLPAQPGRVFPGKVAFVEPVLQELTRTVKVRVELPNPEDLFKPGMYADLEIRHDMGEGLLVPESAVLRTGQRAIVFRTLVDGRFEPVDIQLGGRFGDRFQVLSGLSAGDEVVVSGNFLIDSESRLKSALGGMGHGH